MNMNPAGRNNQQMSHAQGPGSGNVFRRGDLQQGLLPSSSHSSSSSPQPNVIHDPEVRDQLGKLRNYRQNLQQFHTNLKSQPSRYVTTDMLGDLIDGMTVASTKTEALVETLSRNNTELTSVVKFLWSEIRKVKDKQTEIEETARNTRARAPLYHPIPQDGPPPIPVPEPNSEDRRPTLMVGRDGWALDPFDFAFPVEGGFLWEICPIPQELITNPPEWRDWPMVRLYSVEQGVLLYKYLMVGMVQSAKKVLDLRCCPETALFFKYKGVKDFKRVKEIFNELCPGIYRSILSFRFAIDNRPLLALEKLHQEMKEDKYNLLYCDIQGPGGSNYQKHDLLHKVEGWIREKDLVGPIICGLASKCGEEVRMIVRSGGEMGTDIGTKMKHKQLIHDVEQMRKLWTVNKDTVKAATHRYQESLWSKSEQERSSIIREINQTEVVDFQPPGSSTDWESQPHSGMMYSGPVLGPGPVMGSPGMGPPPPGGPGMGPPGFGVGLLGCPPDQQQEWMGGGVAMNVPPPPMGAMMGGMDEEAGWNSRKRFHPPSPPEPINEAPFKKRDLRGERGGGGTPHSGETRRCYNCGLRGHLAQDCTSE